MTSIYKCIICLYVENTHEEFAGPSAHGVSDLAYTGDGKRIFVLTGLVKWFRVVFRLNPFVN